nr:hypothetical protein GCM10020093_104100 [Planobispora longispora]
MLANAEWQAVGVRLGMVDLLRTGDERRVVGHLGPDPLGPDWDAREAVRRLLDDPGRTIGRRCSTSATWPGSGRSTGPRRCSSRASGRGGRWRRSRTSTATPMRAARRVRAAT